MMIWTPFLPNEPVAPLPGFGTVYDQWYFYTRYGTDANDTIQGDEGTKIIYGLGGNDYLLPDTSLDGATVYGGDGADFIYGTQGDDVLYGGEGRDRFTGYEGADAFYGGDDFDMVNYHFSNSRVHVDLISGVGKGGTAEGDTYDSIEGMFGSNHGDLLFGDNGDNNIFGKAGADLINGRAGNDFIMGSENGPNQQADILNGGGGNDTFMFFKGHSDTSVGVDVIQDFDMFGSTGDVMRFEVDDVVFAQSSWMATNLVLNGKSGAFVTVLDRVNGQVESSFNVFLQSIAAQDVTAQDLEFV